MEGIHFSKERRTWKAVVNKWYDCGYYDNEQEAVFAKLAGEQLINDDWEQSQCYHYCQTVLLNSYNYGRTPFIILPPTVPTAPIEPYNPVDTSILPPVPDVVIKPPLAATREQYCPPVTVDASAPTVSSVSNMPVVKYIPVNTPAPPIAPPVTIKTLRFILGLNMGEMGEMMGLDYRSISRIERNITCETKVHLRLTGAIMLLYTNGLYDEFRDDKNPRMTMLALRVTLGITQKKMSILTGIDTNNISQIERDKSHETRLHYKLTKALMMIHMNNLDTMSF